MHLFPLLLAAVAPLHTFSGNDPAQWTHSAWSVPAAAAPADFHSFPCNAAECSVAQVVTDAARNTYAVGSRYFFNQPGGSGFRVSDVFVAKLDPAGAVLFLSTFSGKGNDEGRAIALDPAGNIFIGGVTNSVNFPLRDPIQAERGAGATGFLLKLNPDGSQLIFSTYFGGTTSVSSVNAVATDAAGNLYVTGQTGSRDFPVTPGMPAGPATGVVPGGINAAFVAKLNPAGDTILYSGRISGGGVQCGSGSSCFLSMRQVSGVAIGVDGAGNAYVAGNANVTDLPTTEGALLRAGIGAWAARIKASGAGLDYLTYLGAANHITPPYANPGNVAAALAVDAAGNAYIAGKTSDPGFPATPGAVQPVYSDPANPPGWPAALPRWDGFLAKLNPQGAAMVYATYLGQAGDDEVTGVAIDAQGNAWVTGASALAPDTLADDRDFIYVVNPAGSALSVRFTCPRATVSEAIAVDPDGRVRGVSYTGVVSSFDPAAAGAARVFGLMNAAGRPPLGPTLAPGEVVSLYGMGLGPQQGVAAVPGPGGKMPFELAGTRVSIGGLPAPLLYVSATQINAVTPFALTPGRHVTVEVAGAAGTPPGYPGVVVQARPQIFTFADRSAVLNEDGTINSEANPARPGSVVSAWATGVGALSPLPADGEVPAAAQHYYCCEAIVDSRRAELLYSGAAPGVVAGVVQVNFRLPADLAPAGGQVFFGVTPSPAAPGVASGTAPIWVRP